MPQILIRDLDDATVDRLKARAASHGRSLQGEAKLILERAAGLSFENARQTARQWHKRLAGRRFGNSANMVRQDRQR